MGISWFGVVLVAVPYLLWTREVEHAGGWFTVATLVEFGMGCVVFVVGLITAAYRTTQGDDVQVGSLYMLGSRAPKWLARALWGAFWAAVLIAIFGASSNPFAAMVPMLQLGCVGLWAARHASFPQRRSPVRR